MPLSPCGGSLLGCVKRSTMPCSSLVTNCSARDLTIVAAVLGDAVVVVVVGVVVLVVVVCLDLDFLLRDFLPLSLNRLKPGAAVVVVDGCTLGTALFFLPKILPVKWHYEFQFLL